MIMSNNLFILNPFNFLAKWGRANEPTLFLLTGFSGAGKTTWCLKLAEEAAALGWRVRGLCSPAVFESGHKTAIDLLDLHTYTRKRLAVRKSETTDQLVTKEWQFDSDALKWGNTLLQPESCYLFILDELGPLELERGIGFTNAFSVLDAHPFRLGCVVVRPSLLQTAQERWPSACPINIAEVRA